METLSEKGVPLHIPPKVTATDGEHVRFGKALGTRRMVPAGVTGGAFALFEMAAPFNARDVKAMSEIRERHRLDVRLESVSSATARSRPSRRPPVEADWPEGGVGNADVPWRVSAPQTAGPAS